MQLQVFLPQQRAQDIQKGRRPRTTDDPKEGPKTLQHPETAGIGEHLQLLPPFLRILGGEQPEPLPTLETCELSVARQIRSELINQYLSRLSNLFHLPLHRQRISQKCFQIGRYIRLSMQLVGSPLVALASTAHCSSSTMSSWV